MKKQIQTILLVTMFFTGSAQNILPLDTVILYGDKKVGECSSINIFDTIKVEIFPRSYIKKYDQYIEINGECIDSSKRNLKDPFPFNGKILFKGFNENNKATSYFYNLKTKKLVESSINRYDYSFNIDCGYTTYYSTTNTDDVKVFIIDKENLKKKLFVDLTKYAGWLNYPDGSKKISSNVRSCLFFDDKNAIIFLDNDYDDGGYSNYKYLKIDNGKVLDLTEKFTNSYHWLYMKMISKGKNYIKTLDEIYDKKTYTIKDRNLNYLNEALLMGGYYPYYVGICQVGINIQKGDIENYFLKSELNNGTEVIIPYKFIPRLDIAMYKIYNDTLVTKEELADFGRYELGILRNLIFAKHNYDFSTEFYQAYFNLYAFYNDPEMRKSRTKDINGKLTESDKTNLRLIKITEAEIKH